MGCLPPIQRRPTRTRNDVTDVSSDADTYDRDPQLRNHYQIVQQPSRPDIDIPIDREAAQWRGTELLLNQSPGLGEHNEHVVRELLGRSEEDYVQLILDGVLG